MWRTRRKQQTSTERFISAACRKDTILPAQKHMADIPSRSCDNPEDMYRTRLMYDPQRIIIQHVESWIAWPAVKWYTAYWKVEPYLILVPQIRYTWPAKNRYRQRHLVHCEDLTCPALGITQVSEDTIWFNSRLQILANVRIGWMR